METFFSSYPEAISMLKILLSSKWGFKRVGFWALRLALNLAHIGQLTASLESAELALRDHHVRAGDRLALMRHVARLAKPPRRYKPPYFLKILDRPLPQVREIWGIFGEIRGNLGKSKDEFRENFPFLFSIHLGFFPTYYFFFYFWVIF